MADALSPRLKRKMGKMAHYEPRERLQNEALPPSINVFAAPPYEPPMHVPARAGADNHFQYKSKGHEAPGATHA